MTIGKRIIELRKKANLTQLELAEKLSVTDKAVSKWERGLGEPNTKSIIDMSEIFNVSIDYLLTGDNKDYIGMSIIEKIAFDDDVNSFKNGVVGLYNESNLHKVTDEKGFTLVDYIYKYNSYKLFNEMLSNRSLVMGMIGVDNKYISEFIKMCLELKNYEWITNNEYNSFSAKPLLNISELHFEGQGTPSPLLIKNDIIDFIYKREDVLDFLIKNRDDYWSNAISKVLELMIKNNHPKKLKLLDFIETKNHEANEYWENSVKDGTITKTKNGVYKVSISMTDKYRNYKKPKLIKSYTQVTRETILFALEQNDYKLADRLNKLSGGLISEYEIKMHKVNKDDKMSDKDKLRESVIYDGIVDIDKLIALDDYDLYQETIKLPVSEKECALKLFKDKKYKELLSYVERYGVKLTININEIEKFKEDNIHRIFNNLEEGKCIIVNGVFTEVKLRNSKYIGSRTFYRDGLEYKETRGKDFIFFEDIKDHKDHRFFEHAAKTDPRSLNRILQYVFVNRPKEYKIIKILLDNGAYIPKFDYSRNKMSKDEVATQALKNQIDILMKIDKEK